jgi:phosphopantetheinyl transferase
MELMHEIRLGNTIVAVGHHMHVFEYLDEHLSEEEKELIAPLSPRKKKEWMASRDLLYRISNLPQRLGCVYDSFGKPVLKGSDRFISISHSELWCAAMISHEPCGVDIQLYSATLPRIASRFMRQEEYDLLQKPGPSRHELHLMWGAKECLYKAYGRKKLGFRENIFILAIHPEHHTADGEILYEGLHLSYAIHYRMLPEVAWVFCVQRDMPVVDPAIGM